jgi:hypothetical protein
MLTQLALNGDEMNLDALGAFLEDARERGAVRAAELEALQVEHDLDEESLETLRAVLAESDVEIEADESHEEVELDLTPSAGGTTESLQIFLNGIGQYSLLTASEPNASSAATSPPRSGWSTATCAWSSRSPSGIAATTCRSWT